MYIERTGNVFTAWGKMGDKINHLVAIPHPVCCGSVIVADVNHPVVLEPLLKAVIKRFKGKVGTLEVTTNPLEAACEPALIATRFKKVMTAPNPVHNGRVFYTWLKNLSEE